MKTKIYTKLFAATATLAAWHEESKWHIGELFECIEVACDLVADCRAHLCVSAYGHDLGVRLHDLLGNFESEHLHDLVEQGTLHTFVQACVDMQEALYTYNITGETK